MPTIERAVIVAAGIGKRLQPLTLHTPKPLIPVLGMPMIETGIFALHQNGIREIYVVTGHLEEHFSYLPEKYPGLSLIKNPYYLTCNNISSLYVARDHLKNAAVLEGDLIIKNPAILNPRFDCSGYLAIPTAQPPEWSLTVEDGCIRSCNISAGSGTHRLMGISMWTEGDGARLAHLAAAAFEGGLHDIYWDELALFLHRDAFALGVREIHPEDVTEIDDLQELCAIDPSYLNVLKREGV